MGGPAPRDRAAVAATAVTGAARPPRRRRQTELSRASGLGPWPRASWPSSPPSEFCQGPTARCQPFLLCVALAATCTLEHAASAARTVSSTAGVPEPYVLLQPAPPEKWVLPPPACAQRGLARARRLRSTHSTMPAPMASAS